MKTPVSETNTLLPPSAVFTSVSGFLGVTYAVRALSGEALPKMTCMPNTIVLPEGVDDPQIVETNLYPKGWSVPSR